METFCKAISVAVVAYLGSGLPNCIGLLGNSGLDKYVATVYLICFALGLLGTAALFKQRLLLARGLLLWAIGLPSLVYATHEMTLAFPTYLRAPVSLSGDYAEGQFYHFGIDLIPAALFLTVWFAFRKLAETVGNRESATSVEAGTNASSQ